MILRRLGNKRALAEKLIPLFPKHDFWVEPFFGAGGMFFAKPQIKYEIVNDFDEEVFNLFMVIKDRLNELESLLEIMPIHQGLMKYWNKNKEIDPIHKACRFLLLSNFGYMGKPEALRIIPSNTKKLIFDNLPLTQKRMQNTIFDNSDFECFIKSVTNSRDSMHKYFCYNDPPYIDTTDNYKTENKWGVSDFERLVKCNIEKGWKFGISEFDNPAVLEIAQQNNLNITTIGERQNMKNRRVEIYISNYKPIKELF